MPAYLSQLQSTIPRHWLYILRNRTELGVAVVAVLFTLVFAVTTQGVWLRAQNILEIVRVTSVLAILAFGQALVITTGEIDISVGSVFGIAGILYLAMATFLGALPAALLALVGSAAIGALNGFVVARLRIPSLIVTLGTLFIFRGLAYAIFQNAPSFGADAFLRAQPAYKMLGGGSVFGLNSAVWWALLLLGILNYLLFFTPWGNWLLAIGGDAESAFSRGIDIRKVKGSAFVACALLAGLAGILEASDLAYVDGSFGRQRELEAIAAAVLGGCALAGGRTSLIGTFIGAFILSSIQSYLVINAISPQWFILLLGAIVVLVSLFDRMLSRWLLIWSMQARRGE
ncbi:MAG: monosaccharide-transporting ATPase [Litorilinea sp.]|nr:MAG: monosaccharide-transporting ATPase [Litorilinea sp.]